MRVLKISLISMIILFFMWLFYLVINPSIKQKEILLDDLTLYSISDAIDYINKNDLKYKIVEDYEDNKVKILYTTPSKNTYVKKDSLITLHISKSHEVYLDDYVYTLYKDSKKEIEDFCKTHNIKLDINYHVDNSIPEGLIYKQTMIDKKHIILTIIKHDQTKTTSYIGKNIYEVENELRKYDLNIEYVYIDSIVDYNIIIDQNIDSNKIIKKGNKSDIIFYVSKGL